MPPMVPLLPFLVFTTQEYLAGFYGPKMREVASWVLPLRELALSRSQSSDSGKNNLFLLCFIFGNLSQEEFLYQIVFLLVEAGCLVIQIKVYAAEYFFKTLEIKNKQKKPNKKPCALLSVQVLQSHSYDLAIRFMCNMRSIRRRKPTRYLS